MQSPQLQSRILRRPLRLLVGVWLLVFLACNLPIAPRDHSLPTEPATEITPTQSTVQPPSTEEPPPTAEADDPSQYTYRTQSGDTLSALAQRFAVDPVEITASQPLTPTGLLPPGLRLVIPNRLNSPKHPQTLLPDSEVIDLPSAARFDVTSFIQDAGGYLSQYSEEVDHQPLSGTQIVERAARENSIHPRLLLAVLEYRSGWVFGQPQPGSNLAYPIGFDSSSHTGLYRELLLVCRQLTTAYYGWRAGSFNQLTLSDHTTIRLHPALNAGTVAIQNLFAQLYRQEQWTVALYGSQSFLESYRTHFGDFQSRAAAVEPLFPPDLAAPTLELPFPVGESWSFTGGPHTAWGIGSPRGALDFAPIGAGSGCKVTSAWATASAPGRVVRSANGVVALDLDGDGLEQTGWVLVYLHLAAQDRIAVGVRVQTGDRLGHPSCEGGVATGAHVHLARKYNGEWIGPADPFPFILSGWRTFPGELNYQGTLVKAGQTVTARSDGSRGALILH